MGVRLISRGEHREIESAASLLVAWKAVHLIRVLPLLVNAPADGAGIIESVSPDHLAAGGKRVFAKCVGGSWPQVAVRIPAIVSEPPGGDAK